MPSLVQSQIRKAVIALSVVPVLTLAAPASAQLAGSVGSSNAANQSYQLQNSMRGIQQQQTFNNNQVNAQQRSNQLYNNGTGNYPSGYAPRRSR